MQLLSYPGLQRLIAVCYRMSPCQPGRLFYFPSDRVVIIPKLSPLDVLVHRPVYFVPWDSDHC